MSDGLLPRYAIPSFRSGGFSSVVAIAHFGSPSANPQAVLWYLTISMSLFKPCSVGL